ncbi:MAG: YfhO family protein [Anaerolineae bacterium]|nr:YfhO family protein [Anaerolineae bacterium]
MNSRHWSFDLLSVALLGALCWLFYWRLLTPNVLDQVSFVEGDFSGQFVAFAHYQAQRLGAGEVPLWNPYNLGGHPFLADTQSAVFYPLRLLSIALLNLTGGSTPQRMYAALQAEAVAHALIGSLLMYAFCRTLIPTAYSVPAALIGAITFAYGGFLTGYAPLQLAIMEAAVWLPLALLGILQATRLPERIAWKWFVISGIALGLTLLAGHPQTALYVIYLCLAYLLWRSGGRASGKVRTFIGGALIFGAVGGGLAAVQLLHGWEYLSATTRGTLGFEAKGNGFPFHDLLQIIFPGLFSLYSPLYFGITALMLLIYSAARLRPAEIFWFGVLFIALGLSFGKGAILYDLFYQFAPGFSLFRQQERAAYLVAVAAAVLAAQGASDILEDTAKDALARRYVTIFLGIAASALSFSLAAFIEWLSATEESAANFQRTAFSLLIALLAALLLINLATYRNRYWLQWRAAALLALVVFELFSFGRTSPNFEPIPVASRLKESSALAVLRADAVDQPFFRIDGLRENFGTLYNLPDIRGISPLRFAHVERVLNMPNRARTWQLFGVRYVLTADRELPAPSRIIYEEENPYNPVRLHVLAEPLPLVRVMHRAWIEPDEAQALGYLSDPSYDVANTVMLSAAPPTALSGAESQTARILTLMPEHWLVEAESETDALLRLALVYDGNWVAHVNGTRTPIMRADIAFSAVPIPAGKSVVELVYRPTSYALGAAISLGTLLALGSGGLVSLAYTVQQRARRSA